MIGPSQENKVEQAARVPKFWRTQSLPAQRRFGSAIIEDVGSGLTGGKKPYAIRLGNARQITELSSR